MASAIMNTAVQKRRQPVTNGSSANCDHCTEMKLKLEQTETKRGELEMKLREAEERLLQFQNVLEPACQELLNLNEQLEEEQKSRQDAEISVKQVRAENVKLKRQSHALLKKFESGTKIIDVDIDGCENESLEKKLAEVETERDLLKKKCEREKSECTEKLQSLENKNKELIRKHIELIEKNDELQNLINTFRRTSTLAMEEFAKLQDQMNEEMMKREVAVKFALDCSVREQAIDSRNVLSNSSSPELLAKIEELTKELALEKDKHKREVVALEEALSASEDVKRASSMVTRLEIANSEVERLHKSVLELEAWKEEATKEMETLRSRCEEVSMVLPPPPPPPPPPCPPPPPSILPNPIKIKKTVSCSAVPVETSQQDVLLSDLKDAMNKMKLGERRPSRTIKVGKKIAEKELPSALKELQSVLDKMKGKDGGDSQRSASSSCMPCHKGTPPPTPTYKPRYQLSSSKSHNG